MLLAETKDQNSSICYFDSSNILACKYVANDKKLAIIFKGGRQYVYENVPNYHYQRFKISQSQGVALKKYLQKNYTALRVEDTIDTTPILETINELIEQKKG